MTLLTESAPVPRSISSDMHLRKSAVWLWMSKDAEHFSKIPLMINCGDVKVPMTRGEWRIRWTEGSQNVIRDLLASYRQRVIQKIHSSQSDFFCGCCWTFIWMGEGPQSEFRCLPWTTTISTRTVGVRENAPPAIRDRSCSFNILDICPIDFLW